MAARGVSSEEDEDALPRRAAPPAWRALPCPVSRCGGVRGTAFEGVLSAHSRCFFLAGLPPAVAAGGVGAVEVRAPSPDRFFATPVAFLP